MPACLRSKPSCHASLKFAGYSNLPNGDNLKMSNLKLSQPGVEDKNTKKTIKSNNFLKSKTLRELEKLNID